MSNEPSVPNTQVLVTFDLGEVHELSLDLLRSLEDSDVDLPVAAAALAMSMGRIMSPKVLTQEEEVAFIKSMMEYCGMFFCEGVAN